MAQKVEVCLQWVPSLVQEDPLVREKGMATYSSILAWRISWTEEHGRLQSMGLQRVRHDWATNTHTHTHTYTQINYTSVKKKKNHLTVICNLISISDEIAFTDIPQCHGHCTHVHMIDKERERDQDSTVLPKFGEIKKHGNILCCAEKY